MRRSFYYMIIFVCFALNLYATSAKDTLTFAMLPVKDQSKLTEEFIPLFAYIEKLTGMKTRFIYEENYEKIIDKFRSNKIDIALLGPLPYVKLDQQYKFNDPMILLKQKDGETKYRCVLAKFGKDKINLDEKIKVALTQPLSTCGFYATDVLLQKLYNKELKEQSFEYKMSHENALIGVVGEGSFDLAGVKEDIAHEYKSLGMRIVAKSEYFPGFSLVANTKTLSQKQIKMIQKLILVIPQSTYKNWDGILSNGFDKGDKTFYKNFKVNFDQIPDTGNIDEK